MEQAMLSSAEFVEFILRGGEPRVVPTTSPAATALPAGFQGFDEDAAAGGPRGSGSSGGSGGRPPAAGSGEIGGPGGATFARRLLEAAGFGLPQLVERNSVIRSADPVSKYLPERASYWPKAPSRPYQTLLFEADLTHKDLLEIPAFRSRALSHLDIVEDALARLVSAALEGFQRGGEGVTADVRKGRKDETLCIISIIDQREGNPVRLVCFGTQNKQSEGLETFQITEQTRLWDPQLAQEHLALLYERQFRKLGGADWQDAFTTTEERKQAERLLDICTRKSPKEHDIQEGVLDLLDIIAKGFGLRKKPKTERRLQAFELPSDHDIGINPEERESSFGGQNPFGGVTLRDERSRLLGYIVYPLKTKADAARLRRHLGENNRFHNVLVVYPDENQASLELWQGRDQLVGKLRKGQGYKDAADVVNLLSRFFVVSKAKVRNPTELAQELAYRARYLRRLAVKQLEEEQDKGPLRNLYNAFKEALVHDQTEDEFADAFAQTITYGLLTARWTGNDQLIADGERLTRQTAFRHLPAASPFLNDLFKSALSVKLDEQRGRLLWLVDDIADLLDRIDVAYVFGAGDKDSDLATDPVIHFYEPFLAAYDNELKNKRGVFFTPRPVVSYIVRSVHQLLQTEFGLTDGLASTDTWGDVAKRVPGLEVPEGRSLADPFVTILDLATGTGTFLFECIGVIERTLKERWCRELGKAEWDDSEISARWNEYVPKHLLTRLYGYELMMAPYAIADLKLSFKLRETGYRIKPADRLHVYLTNSLEPPAAAANAKLANLFTTLAQEAQAVNGVKRDSRFTVVLGNPPYSVSSWNTGAWITDLTEDYKRTVRSEESQIQSLSNDYIKFLRLGEWLIERSRVGILGMITGHGYLQGTQPRDMRRHLSTTFDRCYCLDLHGSIRRAGAADPEDEPVFQIMTGVAVVVAVRSARHDGPGKTWLSSLTGILEGKFRKLNDSTALGEAGTGMLHIPAPPNYLFAPSSTARSIEDEYAAFPDLPTIFGTGNRQKDKEVYWATGFASQQDDLAMSFSREEVAEKMAALARSKSFDALRQTYRLCTTDQWNYTEAREFAATKAWRPLVAQVIYRPFDRRWSVLHKHVLTILRKQVMSQLVGHDGEDIGLISSRAVNDQKFAHCFVADGPVDKIFISSKTSTNAYVFPLYIETADMYGSNRRANFSRTYAATLAERLSVRFDASSGLPSGVSGPDIFNYIYAMLHSPTYRSRYGEFLKVDFPRVPQPRDISLLRSLAKLGGRLIGCHLLRSVKARAACAMYVGGASPEVERIAYSDSTVWLDKKRTKGFKGVPDETWNFLVGGYQVCEKWLKDRKGRKLSQEDLEHYRLIVAALGETRRIMTEIDAAIEKYGGWPSAFGRSAAGGSK